MARVRCQLPWHSALRLWETVQQLLLYCRLVGQHCRCRIAIIASCPVLGFYIALPMRIDKRYNAVPHLTDVQEL